MKKVVIIMGSKGDMEHCSGMAKVLEKFGVKYTMRIASAHKVPVKVLEIIDSYKDKEVVFITVAGRSNALSGFVDANTTKPVIASPPYSGKFNGADVFSSLSMPSGVSPMTVLGAEQAALAAVKIFAVSDEKLQIKILEYHKEKQDEVIKSDKELNNGQC